MIVFFNIFHREKKQISHQIFFSSESKKFVRSIKIIPFNPFFIVEMVKKPHHETAAHDGGWR